MISKKQYKISKRIVLKYEKNQRRLNKFKGLSTCPFCNGSKTTPFVRRSKNQNCEECDKNGMIKNKRLAELDLEDLIEKKY